MCGGDLGWAQKVVEAMKLRAGLLIERQPEVFTFPHRTFQEYLAGAHLAAQADFARRAAGLVAEGAQWREVIMLAAGKLVYLSGDLDKPLALVAELCPSKAHDTDLGWQKAWLAGDVLLEVGLSRVNRPGVGARPAGAGAGTAGRTGDAGPADSPSNAPVRPTHWVGWATPGPASG